MEDLCKVERARHKRSKDFLQKVLALNLKMLEPKAENRIDIVDVVRQLSGIIQQGNLETAAGNPLSITPYDGERALGEPDIIGIKSVFLFLIIVIFSMTLTVLKRMAIWSAVGKS
jgi:hypothetical protein